MKRLCILLAFFFPLFLTYTPRLLSAKAISVFPPENLTTTTLSGKNWVYTVPFAVHNVQTIEKLIQCESQGVNVSRPDSDGIISDGILQFHRGPLNTMASSTWESFSRASGLSGSPIDPSAAIRMTDWAIDHGLLGHWSCARLTGLIK